MTSQSEGDLISLALNTAPALFPNLVFITVAIIAELSVRPIGWKSWEGDTQSTRIVSVFQGLALTHDGTE